MYREFNPLINMHIYYGILAIDTISPLCIMVAQTNRKGVTTMKVSTTVTTEYAIEVESRSQLESLLNNHKLSEDELLNMGFNIVRYESIVWDEK